MPLNPAIKWANAQDEAAAKQSFLDIYRKIGVISVACDSVQVRIGKKDMRGRAHDKFRPLSRQQIKRWVDADPEFAAEYQAAHEDAADALEAEARRRAVEGVKKVVLYRGKAVKIKPDGKKKAETVYETKHSDGLMAVLLRAKKPDEFGEKVEVRQNHLHVHTTTTGLPAWFGQPLFARPGAQPPAALIEQGREKGVIPAPIPRKREAEPILLDGEEAPAPEPTGHWVYSCGCRHAEMLRYCPTHGRGFVAGSYEEAGK